MDLFAERLNDLLVDTFKTILKVQEQHIKRLYKINITVSEMHLIEAVGRDDNFPKTISEIAKALDITLSSVTIAINKLVVKDCVKKIKSENDARVVYVKLTEHGKEIDLSHQKFHEKMVSEVSSNLTDEEKALMIDGMKKLNGFFKNKYENQD